ncbi:MAG: hypothetical protein AAGJ11_11155 [Bacteroidota bacterium]
MVVVERTPTRAALREPSNGFIVVANDYLRIDADTGEVGSELMATSCGRFDRAVARLGASRPPSVEACLDVLCDPDIQMGITVQQMVLHARSGRVATQRPA